MREEKLPLFPFLLPWCDEEGVPLRPLALFRSRTFTYTYVAVILAIWNILGPGHWRNCVTLGERVACTGALWPAKMFSAPHEFFLSFLSAPLFHNSYEHIFFVTLCFIVFVQSFEGKNGTKATLALFYGALVIAGSLTVLSMNIGYWLWPENPMFADSMTRYWTGGSAGFMGILGALSHHSSKKWLIPVILLIFEYWNRYGNGISDYITIIHLTSALTGYLFWGWWLGRKSNG